MKYAFIGIGLSLLLITLGASAGTEEGTNARGNLEPFELSEVTKRALDRSAAELIVEPNGDLTLAHNGSHRHVYVARVGANGQVETFCATSERAVRAFLFERPGYDTRGLSQ